MTVFLTSKTITLFGTIMFFWNKKISMLVWDGLRWIARSELSELNFIAVIADDPLLSSKKESVCKLSAFLTITFVADRIAKIYNETFFYWDLFIFVYNILADCYHQKTHWWESRRLQTWVRELTEGRNFPLCYIKTHTFLQNHNFSISQIYFLSII